MKNQAKLVYETIMNDQKLLPLSSFKSNKFSKYNLFPHAQSLPEFFQNNLQSQGRIVKYLKGPQGPLRGFYYQLFKLTFQIEHPQADYCTSLKNIIFDPSLSTNSASPASGKQYNINQYKRIIAQFIKLMQSQVIPNSQLTFSQYPIIDQAMLTVLQLIVQKMEIQKNINRRSVNLSIRLSVNGNGNINNIYGYGNTYNPNRYTPNNSIHNSITKMQTHEILLGLCQLFGITLCVYDKCYSFQQSDVFLYIESPQSCYLAFLSEMAEVQSYQKTSEEQIQQHQKLSSNSYIQVDYINRQKQRQIQKLNNNIRLSAGNNNNNSNRNRTNKYKAINRSVNISYYNNNNNKNAGYGYGYSSASLDQVGYRNKDKDEGIDIDIDIDQYGYKQTSKTPKNNLNMHQQQYQNQHQQQQNQQYYEQAYDQSPNNYNIQTKQIQSQQVIHKNVFQQQPQSPTINKNINNNINNNNNNNNNSNNNSNNNNDNNNNNVNVNVNVVGLDNIDSIHVQSNYLIKQQKQQIQQLQNCNKSNSSIKQSYKQSDKINYNQQDKLHNINQNNKKSNIQINNNNNQKNIQILTQQQPSQSLSLSPSPQQHRLQQQQQLSPSSQYRNQQHKNKQQQQNKQQQIISKRPFPQLPQYQSQILTQLSSKQIITNNNNNNNNYHNNKNNNYNHDNYNRNSYLIQNAKTAPHPHSHPLLQAYQSQSQPNLLKTYPLSKYNNIQSPQQQQQQQQHKYANTNMNMNNNMNVNNGYAHIYAQINHIHIQNGQIDKKLQKSIYEVHTYKSINDSIQQSKCSRVVDTNYQGTGYNDYLLDKTYYQNKIKNKYHDNNNNNNNNNNKQYMKDVNNINDIKNKQIGIGIGRDRDRLFQYNNNSTNNNINNINKQQNKYKQYQTTKRYKSAVKVNNITYQYQFKSHKYNNHNNIINNNNNNNTNNMMDNKSIKSAYQTLQNLKNKTKQQKQRQHIKQRQYIKQRQRQQYRQIQQYRLQQKNMHKSILPQKYYSKQQQQQRLKQYLLLFNTSNNSTNDRTVNASLSNTYTYTNNNSNNNTNNNTNNNSNNNSNNNTNNNSNSNSFHINMYSQLDIKNNLRNSNAIANTNTNTNININANNMNDLKYISLQHNKTQQQKQKQKLFKQQQINFYTPKTKITPINNQNINNINLNLNQNNNNNNNNYNNNNNINNNKIHKLQLLDAKQKQDRKQTDIRLATSLHKNPQKDRDDTLGTFYRQFSNTKVMQAMIQPFKTKVKVTRQKFKGIRSKNYKGGLF